MFPDSSIWLGASLLLLSDVLLMSALLPVVRRDKNMLDMERENTIRLDVVNTLPPGVTIIGDENKPLIRGEGRAVFLCGACDKVLAMAVEPKNLRGLIIRCPACAAYNAVSAHADR